MRRSRAQPCDVLVVCTGNICRSPYIAALLTRRHPSLVIRSAGTEAMTGWPAQPEVVAFLDDDSHIAQQLKRSLIEGSRLIITATGVHRAEVARLVPEAEPRTFTLLELARLLSGTDPTPEVDALLAAAQKGLAAQTRDFDDDLPDPYGLGQPAYDAMAGSVEAALAVIDRWLP